MHLDSMVRAVYSLVLRGITVVCELVLLLPVPCDHGTFGDDCSKQCHCLNGPLYCRTLDGKCTDWSCSYGWTDPPYCQTG